MRYRLFATDIDGTLTPDRRSVNICLKAIQKLRELENTGIKVVLVSSNALPIVVGLRKYLGLTGPTIGETGALIYFGGDRIVHLTDYTAEKALDDVLDIFKDYVVSSWQNIFRLHDFALKIRDKYSDRSYEVFKSVKEYVETKYDYIKTGFSGYAIHLTPIDVSKGKALKFIASELGIDRSEIVCVGDSVMDIDLIRECGLGVAVSNADEELKEKADYVTSKPSCYGVIELIDKIIRKSSF